MLHRKGKPSQMEHPHEDHSHHGDNCSHKQAQHAGEKQEIPAGVEVAYTCPMHPQIRQNKPGNCPICGMALEPEIVSVKAIPENDEPLLAEVKVALGHL